MTLRIRPASPADAEVIAAYNAALARETEDKTLDGPTIRRGVEALLADEAKGRYFVAEREGRVIGQLMITKEWSDWRNGWFWWIQSVYVAREARRSGVYRALHDEAIAAAKREGDVRGIRLYVERENTIAQSTYAALGMLETRYRFFETTW